MSEDAPQAPSGRPRSSAREWALRSILVLSSLAFALVIVELSARVLQSGQRGGKEGGEEARYNEYDPLLGWRKKKDASATYRRREYTVEVRTNSQGLRDPERPIEPPEGVFRVLALGDSFVEGYTVDAPKTVTQVLQRRLGESGCPSDVINGATAAYSTDQEYLFYESDGARYRPSLVLLFVYWNDVLYSDRQDYFGTPKPAFEMGGGSIKLHRFPVREKPKEAAPESHDGPDRPWGSAFLGLARERLWLGAPEIHDRLAGLGLWNAIPKIPARLEILVYDQRDLAPIEDAWEKVGVIIGALNRSVLARGSTLALVYVPSRMEIQEASWQVTKRMYGLDESAWNRAKVRDKLAKLGVSLRIPMVDLSGPLRAAETSKPTYFTFDGHWNARGHEVAAEAVLDWMKTSRSLPTSCGGSLALHAASGEVQTTPDGKTF